MIYKLDVSGPGKDRVSVSFHRCAQPGMTGTFFLKMGLQCSRLREGLRPEKTSAGAPHLTKKTSIHKKLRVGRAGGRG